MRLSQYVTFLVLFALTLSESGPFFTIEPISVNVDTHGTIEFTCAAQGVPPPRIVWYRGSRRLIIKPNSNILQTDVDGQYNHKVLRISNVRYQVDGGDYSCEADNKAGVIRSRKAKLTAPYFLKDKDYFIRTPQVTYTSYPGQGTVVHCQFDPAASWPPAQIFWRKLIEDNRFDNIGSTSSRIISQLNGTMVITQTQPEDSGTYRCGARNVKMGTISESDKTKISVEPGSLRPTPAEIYVPRPQIAVVVRTTAILECIPYGTPPPSILWTKEDGDLPSRSDISDSTMTLTIPFFTGDAAGRYYCSAVQNGETVRQAYIDLSVLEPPEFLVPNRNVTVLEASDLQIPCDCTGLPNPQVSWFKNTEPIYNNINDDNSLTLREVKAISSGMYQCHCSNSIGNAQATFAVKVKGPAKIVSEAVNKTVRQGTEVTLTCEAQGSPTPSIVWLKDGRPLPSDTRIRHHGSLYESTVEISDVRVEDNGIYECKAINENGDASMFIKVSVYGPPFINVKPRDTVGITGSDILVPCEATAEPAPVIVWYRNEKLLGASETYTFTEEGLLIRGVEAEDGGSFMCQARNSESTVSSPPVQVTVYNVPVIEHSLARNTNVTAGKTELLLQCGVSRDFSSYQWYSRGIPLLTVYYPNSNTPRIETRRGIGLYFRTVLPGDQGQYSCNVSNPAAKASVSGSLYVDVMPRITYISPSTEVRENKDFWLDCQYEGEPTPSLAWTHNKIPIRREHTVYTNGTLRIRSASRFDSGAYQCSVTNRQGTRSKDIVINVRSEARIENVPSIQYPITGRQSTLTCEVSGYPFPVVEWWKNGKRIEASKYNPQGYIPSGTNLIISNPDSSSHDGLYTCKASNDFGSDNELIRVQVLDLPVVTRVTGCNNVKEGMECTLACEATGKPLPALSWRYKTFNETVVVRSDNNRYFVDQNDYDTFRELSLTIKNLKDTDTRTYFCHAENPAGKTSKSSPLSVQYGPVITTPPLPSYEVPLGATLTISCSAKGEPSPMVSWRKVKGSLPPNGRSKIDSQTGSLTILNIQFDDSGGYVCTADNNNNNMGFDTVSSSTTVGVTKNDQDHIIQANNPIETWLIIVIVFCVFVVCVVIIVSIKMLRQKTREKRSYRPSQLNNKSTAQITDEANYQYETVNPKPVMFQVPIDSSNSLPMYNLRTLNSWGDGGRPPPSSFQTQFDDVDKQLQGLLKDLDNPKIDNLESDI